MAKLDVDWAIKEIDAFLHVTDQVGYNNRPGSGVYIAGTHMRGTKTDASARAHVVEQILDRALLGWRNEAPEKDGKYTWLRDQAARGKAALQRQAEHREGQGNT